MNLRKDKHIDVGDIVILKNIDSPKMLVAALVDEDAKVVWFDKVHHYQSAMINVSFLQAAVPGNIPCKEYYVIVGYSKINIVPLTSNARFIEYMNLGRKIEAIKLAREVLDLGLKDAKDLVELIETDKNKYMVSIAQ